MLNKPSEKDGHVVSELRSAGAIFYCKTTVPQFLMVPETINDIWGVTNNPYNLNRTSGGSSGGESALISGNGSFIGMGTG